MLQPTIIFNLLLLCWAEYRTGDIRLVGGSYPWEGGVEVYLCGIWGSVTDSHWSADDAQAVCRKLGYFKPGAIPLSDAYFGEGSGVIQLDYVQCSGTEYNFTDCETANNSRPTGHSEDVGVFCQPAPGSFQEGFIHLVGGSKNWEGRVEVYLYGTWATIDDYLWTNAEAQVVCRQLGHSTYNAVARCCSYYGQGSGSIHIDWVHCQGSEPNITSCSFSNSSDGASHLTDVGVQCQPGDLYQEGDIRLVGGSYMWEGRVEIFFSGEWGTISDDYEHPYSAHVVCRQLGYDTRYGPYFEISRCCASFGMGTGPIHLNRIQCSGRELRLIDCRHDNNTNDHEEDWGVVCKNDGPDPGEVNLYFHDYVSSYYRGRVEVYLSETWGRVTGPWTRANAEVVCHQLGHDVSSSSISLSSYYDSYYRQSIPVHLSNVNCSGAESRLIDCFHAGLDMGGGDASMRCYPNYDGRCIAGDIRLVGGQHEREGRVEVCTATYYRWGTVCNSQWSSLHTMVVCRHLGFEDFGGSYLSSDNFGQGTIPIVMDYVSCNGSELRLWDCNHFTHSYGCTHIDDVGVRCEPAHCQDWDIRLVGGAAENEGRVELCLGQRWGTISESGWSSHNAQAVCNQLGYSSTGANSRCCIFGSGGGPVYLTYVSCTGSELSLFDCTYSNDTSGISHYYDSGVQCQPALCDDGEVRLVEGETEWEGRLEVCISQRWGTVSSDGWTEADAQVVCTDFGYDTNSLKEMSVIHARNSKPIFLRNVACSGTELTLLDCSYDNDITENDHTKDVGVYCKQSTCIDGDLRLVNGDTQYDGLLEVCFNQRWGTVNGDGWSTADTQVVCKQLGFQTTDISFSLSDHMNRLSTPIFMDSVACFGTEDRLIDCSYHTDTSEDDHSEDIRVHCSQEHETASADAAVQERTNSVSFASLAVALVVCVLVVILIIYIIQRHLKYKKLSFNNERVQYHIHANMNTEETTGTSESRPQSGYSNTLANQSMRPPTIQKNTAYQLIEVTGQPVQDSNETISNATKDSSSDAEGCTSHPKAAENKNAENQETIYEACT